MTSALIATPICATLLTLLCRIGLGHARRSPATARWHERMPVVGLQGLKTATLEGRLYQTFFLVLFVLVPVAALAHFTLQVLDARVFDRHGGAELAPSSVPEWGAILSTVGGDDRFRLGESAEEGVTWFPVVEPAVLGALLLIAAAHVGLLMRRLFAR